MLSGNHALLSCYRLIHQLRCYLGRREYFKIKFVHYVFEIQLMLLILCRLMQLEHYLENEVCMLFNFTALQFQYF